MDQEEDKRDLETGRDGETVEGGANVRSGWRALFAKRWTFPALYLTAAALIIVLMYAQAGHFSTGKNTAAPAPANNPPAVTASAGSWIWPVSSDAAGAQVLRGYYDMRAKGATVAALAKDLVHFGGSYQGSTGYDIGIPHGSRPFGVVAAASGKVSDVRNSPVMGETVVITTPNGYTTIYQSLGSVRVQAGQTVVQGQQIGTSGRNAREANLGNHLFFAVEKNGVPVDPGSLLPSAKS